MAEQDWKTSKAVFAAVSLPTLFWVILFFLVPMAIVWLYSFGENRGLTDIAISGTLDNYKRATEWLYLTIFGKSFAAEPDKLIEQLKGDEAIAEADTLLLTVPNQLGVDYNAHVIEAILKHVAPGLGWR